SPWQHVDDTQTRVDGKNQHCHIICNPVYKAYHTYPTKERVTVLDVLRNGRERSFRLNQQAIDYLETTQLSQANRAILQSQCSEQDQDEPTFLSRLDEWLPGLNTQHRKVIIDAAAIAAYHAQTSIPVLQALVCDDAPQFKWLTEDLMLCWVHEGRLYKKLIPAVAFHRKLLNDFLRRFWRFYRRLLAYRRSPTPAKAQRLETQFDALFATRTVYDALDKRISLTQAKKNNLLLVLKHPELPLHNNPAELGARQRVRKRDVSFGPRTSDGVRAWDTFMTLAATTKKLDVSFYHYIDDRIRQKYHIPPLHDLVTQAAQDLHLGCSWP
ncbi:MAG: transposase, partial [Anaerolineaceae bacterium]|nr:transposase [Anaerolineaceae bacterium]